MLKMLIMAGLIAVAGLAVANPAAATETGGSGGGIPTGPGCTLNPFDHTWRCIDFDHCTTKPDGTKDCPVTTGTYITGGSGGQGGGKGIGGKVAPGLMHAPFHALRVR